MANGIDWFRWHHGSVNDPKFGLVAKKAGARVGDVIAVWAFVLELASANAERGKFTELDHEATDFLLGADDGTTGRILLAMEDRGLLSQGHVVRWEHRQPKRERETPDTSTARVQKMREKQAAQNGVTANETPCNATERQETPREEKSREEEIKAKVKPTVDRRRPTPGEATPVMEVFDYWKRVMDHPRTVLDNAKVKAIKGRLAEGYTVGDLCKAIDGCKYDPFSQGANDRQTVYDSIGLICRDGLKVDHFIAIAERGPPTGRPSNVQQTINNLQAYLSEHEN